MLSKVSFSLRYAANPALVTGNVCIKYCLLKAVIILKRFISFK